MYLPKHFAEHRPERLHPFMHAHPLALLITQGADGAPVADWLPFELQVDADGRAWLRSHVARANPLWRTHPADRPVLIVFQGAEAYISPNAYPSKRENGKAVPTWNYQMVQARGLMRVVDGQDDANAEANAAWLRQLLHRLTERHEAGQPQPWRVSDAPADFTHALLRAIVGLEVAVDSLVGKFKLSQNQPAPNWQGVHDALAAQGHPMAAEMLATRPATE